MRDLVARRQKDRVGHFMPPGLMESQFATLEPLGDGEGFEVDVAPGPDEIVGEIVQQLERT